MSVVTKMTAAIAACCLLFFVQAAPGQAQNSAKLGASYDTVYTGNPQASINDMGPLAWYYNWGISNSMNLHGKQFVPMVHDPVDVTSQNLATAKTYGNTLLTFNEPENSGVTVDQALSYWPQLMATGMRLGSPATGAEPNSKHTTWQYQFMDVAIAKGYRVDFINLHPYPDVGTNHDAVAAADWVITQVQDMHNRYNKPIWITEMALSPWATPPTAADNLAFMQNVLPKLEALPYVERYCWWTLNFQSYVNNLCDTNGNVLPLGNSYKNFVPAGGGGAIIANGMYTMTPASGSGMRLDAFGGGTANGSQAGIWTANGGYNQNWLLENRGGNTYRISPNYAPNLCLDDTAWGGSGTLINLWTYGGGLNQQWTISAVNGGYTFSPVCAPGTCLDTFGYAAGTQSGIWTTNGGPTQTWTLF